MGFVNIYNIITTYSHFIEFAGSMNEDRFAQPVKGGCKSALSEYLSYVNKTE